MIALKPFSRSAWVVILVGMVLCMTCVASADDIDDLAALFEDDPAQGFVEARRMFEVAKDAGDLDGMAALAELTADAGERYRYSALGEEMIDQTIAVARDRGRWETIGNLYSAWAELMLACSSAGQVRRLTAERAVAFAELAGEAYARAGNTPERLAQVKKGVDRFYRAHEIQLAQANSADLYKAAVRAEHYSLIAAINDAVGEGRDPEAMEFISELVSLVMDEPDERIYFYLLHYLTDMVWLPGGDRVLATVRNLAEDRELSRLDSACELRSTMACAATWAWSGRDDEAYETFRWCEGFLYANATAARTYSFICSCIEKMLLLDQTVEANRLTREWVEWLENTPQSEWHGYPSHSAQLVQSMTAPQLRRRLLDLTMGTYLYLSTLDSPATTFVLDVTACGSWRHVAEAAPAGQERQWALETAEQLLDWAVLFPDSASRTYGTAEAARLFREAGREDLAADAEASARQIAANDPKAMLQCALSTAKSRAEQRKWEDVVTTLQPAVSKYASGKPGLQAMMMLAEACQELGKTQETQTWVTKASGLMDQAGLTSVERTNYLWNMASLSRQREEQLRLLMRAQTAAAEAELPFLEEKIADRLAEVALAAGNLALAEQKLIEIVKRQEEEREQLAFDPLLRQQWFADNIGPYRRLMRVAALRAKPQLALSCAERMRSRALLDQLSWQKVDVGLRLGRGLEKQLTRLREMRKEAYGLLQRVLGGSVQKGDDTRGMYMPIRGMYIPIRGGLGDGKAATQEDVAYLRDLLADLAQEEEALNSSIREEIPDYWEDCYAEIPSSEEMEKAIASQDGLALLEYTFCDEGLTAIGMTFGHDARVVFIDEKGEQMWERIGKFRQLIWERKPEFADEARKLYATLIAPFEDMLADADRVWIVADGALQLLPFGALVDGNNTYLSGRIAVATVPSLSLMMTPRETVKVPEATALIVAAPDTGAPDIAGDKRGMYIPIRGMYMPIRGMYMPIRGEGGVSSALTMMANVPLPGAKAEGEALAKLLPKATLLTGKEATRSRLLEQGERCEVLHIATHGYADPDFPEFSGLLLAGEGDKKYDVLTAQDVRFWSLRARLVTLSACQTALGKAVAGEGLLGLTRAFIYAGAQDVLCSLWPVSDESTKALMVSFYKELDRGMTVEEALQHAQLELMRSEATRHPFFWAGFVPVRGPE